MDARNLLFEALRPRFAPMFRRIRANPIWRSREGRAWTFDDLEQETFLIVCELIRVWKGGDTIVGHFFARLPWRLRDVLRRWTRPARLDKPGLPIGLPVDDVTDLVQVQAVLERVFQGLPGRDANVLRMRVIEGLSDEKIGARLGVNPRTIRRWRQQAYPQAQAIYLAEKATTPS
jgi:RNA polymerase sigma factor (sigma-70 family)